MSEELQSYINKINEMQNTIEWQKLAIKLRDDKIEKLEIIIKNLTLDKSCENCEYFDGIACSIDNNCLRFNGDYEDSFEPKNDKK